MFGETEPTPSVQREIYSVTRLNREVRAVLEGSFPLLWVEGEISNLARPASGHLYFSLKDPHSQVRCALFRMQRQRLRFAPQDGMQVLVRARVSLYEGRGEFQLIVEHMEPAGEGALRQAFERLKQQLAAEGLFDAAHKRPLPAFPQRVGVITSPVGAAVRDVLSVLRRRLPQLPVIVYPVQVQGAEAPEQIVEALRLANVRAECDVLILTRGGGSLEDLAAFNDERVARAVFASRVPVVAGVGHEIDFTIADFVADHRAATPSAAAEHVSPDRGELGRQLGVLQQRLRRGMQRRCDALLRHLEMVQRRLRPLHPGARLLQRLQRQDELEQRLARAMRSHLQRAVSRLATGQARLSAQTPAHRLEQFRLQTQDLERRLLALTVARIASARSRLERVAQGLGAVSPLATLARGYALVYRLPQRDLVRSADAVRPGERVEVRLADGSLICTVDQSLKA